MKTVIHVEIIKSRLGMGDIVMHLELRPNEGSEAEIQEIIPTLAELLDEWEDGYADEGDEE